MTGKIGPYGSHYGTGCYTKDCNLRGAADAGIIAPVTFEAAKARLDAANASNKNSSTKGKFNESEQEVNQAKLAYYSTPEGQKQLKSEIKNSKKVFGKDHTVVISQETLLQKAINKRDKDNYEFHQELFLNASTVTSKDLRSLTGTSTDYDYIPSAKSIVNNKTQHTLVSLNEDGTIITSNDNWSPKETFKPGTDGYDTAKKNIAAKISQDVYTSISARPTVTSRINDTLNSKYSIKRTHKPDGSYTGIVTDKKGNKKLAVFEYNKNGVFESASWSKEDGTLIFPEKNSSKILSLLKTEELTRKKELPDWY